MAPPTPGKAPYDGSNVEWIVEGPYTAMPNFENVKFTNISAGTHHHTIDLSAATTINAVNQSDGTTLATGKILLKKNEVEVTWNAAQ